MNTASTRPMPHLVSLFEAVTHSLRWNTELLPELQRRLRGRPPLLRLAPTTRSLLR